MVLCVVFWEGGRDLGGGVWILFLGVGDSHVLLVGMHLEPPKFSQSHPVSCSKPALCSHACGVVASHPKA